MPKVYVVGTCDTKGDELRYAVARVRTAGAEAVLVDVSTRDGSGTADFSAAQVASHHPGGAGAVLGLADRGAAVTAMSEALTAFLLSKRDVGAVLGLGGTGNTALVTAAMRALPVGIPKLMVSTVAAGNVSAYVGPADVAMMHSVVDVAGLNPISRRVIANAAHAVAGMASHSIGPESVHRRSLGITMFGVTTPCVTALRSRLETDYDCFVFHATGTGGQSMEKLVDSGLLDAVIDVTTTEVADHLVGGVMPCTDDRFGAVIRRRVPYVGSVGAVDMVNFGARATVPARFEGRRLHAHNAQVTLMRTTPAENRAIGEWIVERINRMQGPVRFLLPLRGVSAIDAPGQPFADPDADAELFAAIRRGWNAAPHRMLVEVDAHINDPEFAQAALGEFAAVTAGARDA